MKPKSLLSKISGQPEKFKVDDIDSYVYEDQKDINQRLKNNRYESDTKARGWLAKWTAIIVSVWLVLVMATLFFNNNAFNLDDKVLITLLGTTTLNVLGLSFIVLRGHFQSNEKEERPKKKKTTTTKKAATE